MSKGVTARGPILGELTILGERPILRERPILGAMPRGADKPATVVSHSSDSLIKPEIPNLDFALPPGNRELVFSLHVLPGALVSCLQIDIVEKLSAGTWAKQGSAAAREAAGILPPRSKK